MEMLATVWYLIIGFIILMYVLLDGFDLGVGILFPLFKGADQNLMMSSILPVWDGNQTWLVLGVACLYGAFPQAFSLFLPAFYLPLMSMIIALLLRGITFEFRIKEKKYRWIWSYIFFLSSITVAFLQGLVLGSFVKGFELNIPAQRLEFSIFTPFNITCGVALIFGYALLGSTWIISKTTGAIQTKMFSIAFYCLWITTFFMCVVSIWSPFVDPSVWQRWFSPENFNKVAILPCITAVIVACFAYCVYKRYEYILYWLAVIIFMCSYIGVGISTWPYLIPHHITYLEAAGPLNSQLFMLVGTLLLLPILIAYTSYAYYIFRNKVSDIIDY